jgi:hypothetical protein
MALRTYNIPSGTLITRRGTKILRTAITENLGQCKYNIMLMRRRPRQMASSAAHLTNLTSHLRGISGCWEAYGTGF